jgi:hypothetical protein
MCPTPFEGVNCLSKLRPMTHSSSEMGCGVWCCHQLWLGGMWGGPSRVANIRQAQPPNCEIQTDFKVLEIPRKLMGL